MSRFNLREVSVRDDGEARDFIARFIQPSAYGAGHMAHKSRILCLLADGVRDPAAHIIKETMLSVGGEAAIHRDTLTQSCGHSRVLLLATAEQFTRAVQTLKKQQFGMVELAAEIEERLARRPAGPRILRCGSRELVLGERTLVMGILNVTPDSFSDGGRYNDAERAVTQALRLQEEGADLLDIGAESTAPGNAPISAEEEQKRLLPLLEKIAARVSIPISVDTYKAATARLALQCGGSIINDVWGFQKDPEMAAVAADSGCPAILMHNHEGTEYADFFGEVLAFLRRSIELATAAGCEREQLIVDPGFGFGKTARHNLALVNKLSELSVLGQPILMAASRKRTIGALLDASPEERLEGDIAVAVLAAARGAELVRVHDVKPVKKALTVADAVLREGYC